MADGKGDNMKKILCFILALVLATALVVTPLLASEPANFYSPSSVNASGRLHWTGQGVTAGELDTVTCEGEDVPDYPYLHWIFNTDGGFIPAGSEPQLVLGGSGSGIYYPTKYNSPRNNFHFYTPYSNLSGLTAYVAFETTDFGTGAWVLTISEGCPGVDYEELTVSKTAVTSYVRTHDWDIAKSVDTKNGYELDEIPKIWLYIDGSGDETATWTVDVSYEGHEDSDHNVSGIVTIENNGTLDAVITHIEDLLAGTPVTLVDGPALPYTLTVGATITYTYNEDVDSKVCGFNEVTVTTERDEYFADAEIVWGDPDEEINETVTIKDISDLFGEVELGTATAPNGAQFTYDQAFAWADYSQDDCGSHIYNNTATIVEIEDRSASATLKVNVQCYIYEYEYETAYAKGDTAICFIPHFGNWGWTNPIMPDTYEMELWAAAGQCDTGKGTLVGSVTVVYGVDGHVTAAYNVASPYKLGKTHFYAGYTMFPQMQLGRSGRTRDTVAPGQYYNAGPFDGSQIYVIAQAEVGIPILPGIPDPNFGP